MAQGTARIAVAGGNIILAAATAYDRQLFLEYVRVYARRNQHIRVHVDQITWIVEVPDGRHAFNCGSCARRIGRVVCWRTRNGTPYCLTCAMERPPLTIPLLVALPETTILRDVPARYAYGADWIPWTRWPEATPAEIINDMRLQWRFAPVLVWRCAEIRLPPSTGAVSISKPPALHSWQRAADTMQPSVSSRRSRGTGTMPDRDAPPAAQVPTRRPST